MPDAKTFFEEHDKATLFNICGGAAAEMFDAEFERVVRNALDPNTKLNGKREITITIAVKPNEGRTAVNLEMDVTSKVAGCNGVSGVVYTGITRLGKVVTANFREPSQDDLFPDAPTPPRAVITGSDAPAPATQDKRIAQ